MCVCVCVYRQNVLAQRPSLRLILMSATMNTHLFQAYFYPQQHWTIQDNDELYPEKPLPHHTDKNRQYPENSPPPPPIVDSSSSLIAIPGRTFPVSLQYLPDVTAMLSRQSTMPSQQVRRTLMKQKSPSAEENGGPSPTHVIDYDLVVEQRYIYIYISCIPFLCR